VVRRKQTQWGILHRNIWYGATFVRDTPKRNKTQLKYVAFSLLAPLKRALVAIFQDNDGRIDANNTDELNDVGVVELARQLCLLRDQMPVRQQKGEEENQRVKSISCRRLFVFTARIFQNNNNTLFPAAVPLRPCA